MPVRAHELVDGGVVLVCSTTGLPLPVSMNLFTTEEAADWFLASLSPRDARTIEAGELQALAASWVAMVATIEEDTGETEEPGSEDRPFVCPGCHAVAPARCARDCTDPEGDNAKDAEESDDDRPRDGDDLDDPFDEAPVSVCDEYPAVPK